MSRTARKMTQALAELELSRKMIADLSDSTDALVSENVYLRTALQLQQGFWEALLGDANRKPVPPGGQRVGMPHPLESAPENIRRYLREEAKIGIEHAKDAVEFKR